MLDEFIADKRATASAYAEYFKMDERIARKDVDAARAKEVIIKYDRQDRNAPYHINMRYLDGG